MRIPLRSVLVIVFISFVCTSCADAVSPVPLELPADVQDAAADHASGQRIRYAPLKALNENAQAGVISVPEKFASMTFAFEKSPEMLGLTGSGLYALELEFEPLASVSDDAEPSVGSLKSETTGTVQIGSVRGDVDSFQIDSDGFAVGLLYANDFSASGKVEENTRPPHSVTAQLLPHGTFTVSIGFAGIEVQAADIRGFMIYSQAALKLNRAAIVPVRYGWIKEKSSFWYGTTADGGVIPPELCAGAALPQRITLPKPSAVLRSEHTGRDSIVIHFNKNSPIDLTTEQNQPCLLFRCGNRQVSVYRAPQLYRFTLDGSLFPEPFLALEQTDTDELTGAENTVSGITAAYHPLHPLAPITADPGLILRWPQEHWRQPAYELFSWEQFPSVLIFDFADYTVQDTYLKRISFFAEKRGFTGQLLSDKTIAALHGFNAHDYRAETLAAFFRKAEEENFPLNKSELHLRTILFHAGIIIRRENGIEAGRGAILSISRQSPSDLRYRFMTHECMHGIYFTEESFRDTVSAVFRRTDPRVLSFLRRYFEVYPTLQYNTDDHYLFQNECMAYLLQQDRRKLRQYYTRISWFRIMSNAEPALCRYIRKTNADAFMNAAAQMESFLYTTWGLKSGRVYLGRINPS